MSASTGTASRRSRGTPIAALRWTMPTTSSTSSSTTGNRLKPVRRAQDHDVGGALPATHHLGAHPRRHDVGRGAVTEVERARDDLGGGLVERADLGRAPHERRQLLRRAGAGQLLLRLDADGPQHPVGAAVEQRRSAGRTARVKARSGPRRRPSRSAAARRCRGSAAGAHRRASRTPWRGTARARRRAAGPARPDAPADRSGGSRIVGERRLDEEADDERRERDADLRAGELRGEAPDARRARPRRAGRRPRPRARRRAGRR